MCGRLIGSVADKISEKVGRITGRAGIWPGWQRISYMLKSRRNYEANTISTTRLAIAARNELFAMAQDEHIDFDHEGRGILHIYRTRRDHDHARRVNDLLRKGGLERRAVSDEEIRGIEPALQGKFYGGFYTPSDSTGDIHKFTRGLVHACERRGARFWGDRGRPDDRAWIDWSANWNGDGFY